MNQRIKKLWIEALRSGKYKQADGRLRDSSDRFCCLGVLCDLHSKETDSKWKEIDDGEWAYGRDATGVLPPLVQRWAGINRDPELGSNETTAASLNDGGKSFKFIASRIEKYL